MENKYKTIKDLNIKEGTKVLLRLDLNVPTDENGRVTNDFRIRESLPTIFDLKKKGAKVIIIAHKEEGSLENIAKHLREKIADFSFHPLPESVSSEFPNLLDGQVVLLENVRNDKREKSKSQDERDEFAKILSKFADCYINEAFSASHRNHASITSIPKFLPSCIGPKFQEEIQKLGLALLPKHPSLLIVGGSKFDTKLPMIEKFLNISDKIFVGGALAHSFWKSKNYELGTSLIDTEVVLPDKVLTSEKIVLPSDIMLEDRTTKSPDTLNPSEKIIDFGPETLKHILELANNSNTIIWNGPLDYYEKGYDWGTKELIENFSKMSGKTIILGGGDTVSEIDKSREEKRVSDPEFDFQFTHISTGGGAMIDFLSNGTLPGLEAIVK